jgi:hypothetical protein
MPNVVFSKLRAAGGTLSAFARLISYIRPHLTALISILAVLISMTALSVSIYSTLWAVRGMKAAQRAYLTYQVTVTNGAAVLDSIAKGKDFFMSYQMTITNVGNTPARFITPKIRVMSDPDRPPLMVTFPTNQFDLGPKESRTLPGQALFRQMHRVRQIPGFSTGFNGQIEYVDVFGDPGVWAVCYQLVFESSLTGGFCGSVLQELKITDPAAPPNP